MLPGKLTVTGVTRAGRPVTGAVRVTVAPGPALSPGGTGPGRNGRMPAGQVSASLLLIAAGTHPAGAPSCSGHHVDPAAFRVTLASGGSVSTRNASSARGPALTGDGRPADLPWPAVRAVPGHGLQLAGWPLLAARRRGTPSLPVCTFSLSRPVSLQTTR
jgi:hypothetical protein